MKRVTRLVRLRQQRREMADFKRYLRQRDLAIADRIEAGAALFLADPKPDGPQYIIDRWQRRRDDAPRSAAFVQRLRDGEVSVALSSVLREMEWAERNQ